MEDDDIKLLPRPKRALTAYNYFFHFLRAKLLSGEALDDSEGELNDGNGEEGNDNDNTDNSRKDDDDNTIDQNDSTSKAGLFPHSGSKISFASLGKAVGRRWHRLTDEQRQEFVQKAAIDKERYNREMVAYTEQQKNVGKLRKKELQQERKKQRKNDATQRKKTVVQPISSATTLSSVSVAAGSADYSNNFPPISMDNSSTANIWSRSNTNTGFPHQYYRDDPALHPRALTAPTATNGTSDGTIAASTITQNNAASASASNFTPYSGPFSYYAQRPNTESYYNPYYPYEPQATFPTAAGTSTSAYDAYYYPPQPYSATTTTANAYDHQNSSVRFPMSYYQQQYQLPYTLHNRSHTASGANEVDNHNESNEPSLPDRTARFVTVFFYLHCCTYVS